MSKKTLLVIMLIATLTIVLLAKPQFITKVNAQGYTETEGTLDGAHFVVRFPEDWNGMLVIFCRGLSFGSVQDARPSLNIATSILDQGYAVAASTYGADGWCVAEGINATYQLTMHIINTYSVTGKIFLVGSSMGGFVVLMLAEKYPNIYSGVLALSAGTDLKVQYEYGEAALNMTNEEIREYINAPPTVSNTSLSQVRYMSSIANPMIAELLGGTPTEQPEAYEEISPAYHANISIPVIMLQGDHDCISPMVQMQLYQDAVNAAGSSSYLRAYVIPGGGHVDSTINSEVPTRIAELVSWAEIIPECLSVSVMLLLSTVAAIVGICYLRKRPKLER